MNTMLLPPSLPPLMSHYHLLNLMHKTVAVFCQYALSYAMKTIAAITLLSACMPPLASSYHPISVAEDWQEVFELLANDVNQLAGSEVLAVDAKHGEGRVESNQDKVELREKQMHIQDSLGGFTFGRDITLKDSSTLWSAYHLPIMAHEIGHAMGLAHSDHGIMKPYLDEHWFGHEAELLVEALREQKAIK